MFVQKRKYSFVFVQNECKWRRFSGWMVMPNFFHKQTPFAPPNSSHLSVWHRKLQNGRTTRQRNVNRKKRIYKKQVQLEHLPSRKIFPVFDRSEPCYVQGYFLKQNSEPSHHTASLAFDSMYHAQALELSITPTQQIGRILPVSAAELNTDQSHTTPKSVKQIKS